ncbi:hypothetical protein [Nannocystis punicea]|uniref:hypothetical protein n=1 Tax=Nannocystis punicea TaxID=2995304 RepID=UPI0035314C65
MKPSIGRVVHHHPNLEGGALTTRAAIITGVNEEDESRVDLTVFPPRAEPYREVLVDRRGACPHVIGCVARGRVGPRGCAAEWRALVRACIEETAMDTASHENRHRLSCHHRLDAVDQLPSSPELNPIELAWSKIKTALRGLGARTVPLLKAAISAVAALVTPADAPGWFKHCGVSTPQGV